MSSTVRQLADLVGGRVEGDGEIIIESARPLRDAGPGAITFVDHERHRAELGSSGAAAAVVSIDTPHFKMALIRVADPRAAFTKIAQHLHARPPLPVHGIDPLASVNATARIGAEASVEAFAAIGAGTVIGSRCRIASGAVIGRDCRLGDDVTLHAHVVLYDGTILGNRVTVHANSVLGADGFGYRFENGRHVKVPQLGSIEIGDDVEIGACSTIDRGTFGATRIGTGTKIDNLVMVAHNCSIGRHNILVSQMGMAGSSSTGDYVMIAGQVGVVGHVHIGDRSSIGGQAAVTKDVAPGSRMLGSPATPEQEQKRMLMALARLPEVKKSVRRILQHLGLQAKDINGRAAEDQHAA
jgi:UDP-3-O-[3-hydroxymyristoyl] glucosamine N-acyltransferase